MSHAMLSCISLSQGLDPINGIFNGFFAAIEKLFIPLAHFVLVCFARFSLCPKMSHSGHKLIFPRREDDDDDDRNDGG